MLVAVRQFHLRTAETIENRNTPFVTSCQYTLTQQLVERDPLFYLLNLVFQRAREKPISLVQVAYPNSLVHAVGGEKNGLVFAADPTRGGYSQRKDGLRALVPITFEDNESCDRVLDGVDSSSKAHQFLSQYDALAIQHGQLPHAPGPNCTLDIDLVDILLTERHDPTLSLNPRPIDRGAIRFLRSTTGTSCHGSSPRLALQPQLVALEGNDDRAELANGLRREELNDLRSKKPLLLTRFGGQLSFDELRTWPLSTTLPGPTALSDAISGYANFTDHDVISEISILLGGDEQAFRVYVDEWQRAAKSTYALQFRALELAGKLFYDKSYEATEDPDVVSEVEMAEETSDPPASESAEPSPRTSDFGEENGSSLASSGCDNGGSRRVSSKLQRVL